MIQIGDKVPKFTATALINNKEQQITLSQFKNKIIVLYFYPKDLTPGCTTQAENIRDNFNKFEKNNIIVIGVSKDPIKSHIKFQEKKDLQFILISDEDLKINQLFEVWVEKNMY